MPVRDWRGMGTQYRGAGPPGSARMVTVRGRLAMRGGGAKRALAAVMALLLVLGLPGQIPTASGQRDGVETARQEDAGGRQDRDARGQERGGGQETPAGDEVPADAPAEEPVAEPAPEPAPEPALGPDTDGDFIADVTDNCPGVANIGQQDANRNGYGDICEPPPPPPDTDGDGVPDDGDNCVDVANGNQNDGDGNGVGNACDVAPAEPAPEPAPEEPAGGVGDGDAPPAEPPAEEGGRGNGGERTSDGGGDGSSPAREEDRPDREADETDRDRPVRDEGEGEDAGQGLVEGAAVETEVPDPAVPAARSSAREGNLPELAPPPDASEPSIPALRPFVPPAESRSTSDDADDDPVVADTAGAAADPRSASRDTIVRIDSGALLADDAESGDDAARGEPTVEPGQGDATAEALPGEEDDDRATDEEAGDDAAAASDEPLTRIGFQRDPDTGSTVPVDGDGADAADAEEADEDADPEATQATTDAEEEVEVLDGEPVAGGAAPTPRAARDSGSRRAAREGRRDGRPTSDRDTAARSAADEASDEEDASDVPAAAGWDADEHFAGGLARTLPRVTRIAGTDDDVLYVTQRRGAARGKPGSFAYEIPVPEEGEYAVRLHFAEIYWGAPGGPDGGEGKRVFSVDAEGETELEDYDIYGDVGAMTAVVKQFAVAVDDGTLDLRFHGTRDQPMVAAIEVLRSAEEAPPPAEDDEPAGDGERRAKETEPRSDDEGRRAEEDDSASTAPLAASGERWVDVDKSAETVRLMAGNEAVARFQASMSEGRENGFRDTVPGSYTIQSKTADLTYTPYAKNYITYWAGFDPSRENGFHSWVMDAKGRVVPNGDGPTWGCVATAPRDAAQIYDFVEIGTRVEVHW